MSEPKRFPSGAVASPHYLASSAGLAVLADGGNALDAAIATNLVLGVVTPYMCGYGGDLFALIWAPPGRGGGAKDGLHAYNGSGRAPAAATLEAVRGAAGSDRMPGAGPLTVSVPGAVEAWFKLLERFGTRSFADLAARASRYAHDGFPLSAKAAGYIGASASIYTDDWAQAWRSVYADAKAGARLRQPDLARTIDVLRAEGPEPYYRGSIGEAIARTLRGHGALMDVEDLAQHAGDWVEPLSTSYRGVDVYELPPNSQGVVALEALNILEDLDLGPSGSASRVHVLIEAVKLALADRNAYVTDPGYMRTPAAELASKEWARRRRAEIDPDRASAPTTGRAAVGGTIYLCAADADGMLVSLIQSNYVGFGSGVSVPGWGINLQNRGAYFSLDPSHTNAIAPRKRTMHTLMPAMAFRDGSPWLVFGSMGGDGQAQTHVQFLNHVIDDGGNIQDAIDAARWVVSPSDWSIAAESRVGEAVMRALRVRGHTIDAVGPYETQMGHAHAIEVTDDGYIAATDPRAEGAALGQ
ncbi:MAG TPA: gamma-glutamyltransferase [Actinomycetota bacterium]|jgi:gamma-glutamyltranspeptidase/glutathione hydrolase|nr:gamma-glutamyltransferase [Actinomycetota bacterium]